MIEPETHPPGRHEPPNYRAEDLQRFAAQHYPELEGKTIPAGIMLAFVFMEHEHPLEDDGPPMVQSLALENFIRVTARRSA